MRHDSGPDKKKKNRVFIYLFFNSLQDWAHLRPCSRLLGTLGKGWRTDVYLQEMLLTAIGGDFNDFILV